MIVFSTSARGIMNLVSSSRAARCRSRFVVPVMLYGGKVGGAVTIIYNSLAHASMGTDAKR